MEKDVGLRVLSPGLLATVQDLGRHGFARAGVPASGAADPFSARLANLVLGNPERAAVVEMTLAGAAFEAAGHVTVAACGAPMPMSVNGAPAGQGEPIALSPGDRIAFGACARGARCYLAVEGGFEEPEVLGSRSTQLEPGFGGHAGRPLSAGDRLCAGTERRGSRRRALAPGFLWDRPAALRAMAGPQAGAFSAAARETFYSASFRVSARSNRAGLRLSGAEIPAADPPEIAPEGMVPGAVEVPAGGEPIVLMPEGPVTGGYPVIAVVIAADRCLLGQLRPGDAVRFSEVDAAQAARARAARERQKEDLLRSR